VDLRLYGRVIRRFKFVVLLGFLAAIGLSFLSYARVSFVKGKPVVSYRAAVTYSSTETLLITQTGFPEGRSIFPMKQIAPGTTASQFADPSRFASLAAFYAYLANSDQVKRTAMATVGGPLVPGSYLASAVLYTSAGNPALEPLLAIEGLGTSPTIAMRYARAAGDSFRTYIDNAENAAKIPTAQRVIISVLNSPAKPMIAVPRKKTLPMVVFIAVLAATLAFVFVLENLKPRIKAVEAGAQHREPVENQRSTA